MRVAICRRGSVKKITFIGLLAAAGNLPAQRSSDAPAEIRTAAFPAELDRYIADVLVKGRIPGIGIAVVRNDSVLVAKGYGVRELGKPGRVDANTVFDIASVAKSFTATLVAMLVDRGVVHWDTPARRHLPDLMLPTAALTERVTLRDLLSHRSGLEPANMMWVPTAVDRTELIRRARYLKVQAPLGERMIYSNVGYSLGGYAAAAAAGRSFEDLLRDLVIRPLGLTSTTWSYDQAAGMPNLASSHATLEGRQQPLGRERQREGVAPAAAVQSTMHDLTRWMRLHLNRGMLDGVRYVSDSAMGAMHSMQVVIQTTPEMRAARQVRDSGGYGLGLQVMDYRGHPMLWHTGNGDGQIAYLVLYPRDRLGIAVAVNTWWAPLIHMAIGNRITDHYLGYPFRDWAGEALARIPGQVAARDSSVRALLGGGSAGRPPKPLPEYAGEYQEDRFGPLVIRAEGSGLTLQMGQGQVADLAYHRGESFLVRWRDPFFREFYLTQMDFTADSAGRATVHMLLNRDHITAVRRAP